jgi:hypothetical protein
MDVPYGMPKNYYLSSYLLIYGRPLWNAPNIHPCYGYENGSAFREKKTLA